MVVICDLDRTLLKSDSTVLFLRSLKFRIVPVILTLMWTYLKFGKFEVKRELARVSSIKPVFESVNLTVLDALRVFQQDGLRVILISASNDDLVRLVALHFGIQESYGSTAEMKLKGFEKLRFIGDLIGSEDYIYLGDSIHDFPIWEKATVALVVRPSRIMKMLIRIKFPNRDMQFIF
jgi:phosphoserine phosphatase